MRILVLNGSPRPKGNTKQMVDAFQEGAESVGHQVDVIDVCKKKIAGCLACEYCHTKGNGDCVQKDDMQEVYSLLTEADMLVVASPIYYHGISGQLKCVIDRFYSAAYPRKPQNLKKVAMILSSGDPICMMVQCFHTREISWIILVLRIWECLRLMAGRMVLPQS